MKFELWSLIQILWHISKHRAMNQLTSFHSKTYMYFVIITIEMGINEGIIIKQTIEHRIVWPHTNTKYLFAFVCLRFIKLIVLFKCMMTSHITHTLSVSSNQSIWFRCSSMLYYLCTLNLNCLLFISIQITIEYFQFQHVKYMGFIEILEI